MQTIRIHYIGNCSKEEQFQNMVEECIRRSNIDTEEAPRLLYEMLRDRHDLPDLVWHQFLD